MSESIWTGPSTGGEFNDGQPIATGTKFVVATDGFINGVRFWAPASGLAGATFTGALWQVTNQATGMFLDSAAKSGTLCTPSAWNYIPFAAPVAVTAAGLVYQTCIHNTAGWYIASGGYFLGGPHINGNLTAIQDNTNSLANGSFDYSAVPATYPKSFFNGGNYWVDVDFVTSLPSTFDASRFFAVL